MKLCIWREPEDLYDMVAMQRLVDSHTSGILAESILPDLCIVGDIPRLVTIALQSPFASSGCVGTSVGPITSLALAL